MLVVEVLKKATFKGIFANVPTNNKLPQKKKTNGLQIFKQQQQSCNLLRNHDTRTSFDMKLIKSGHRCKHPITA